MQNIRDDDELGRFAFEVHGNHEHYVTLIKNKNECLVVSSKKVTEEMSNDYERVKTLRDSLQVGDNNKQDVDELLQKSKKVKENIKLNEIIVREINKIGSLLNTFYKKYSECFQRIEEIDQQFELAGLTPEPIEKFEHFVADESLLGEQCIVCLDDLEVGTQMVRHKTCPTCNHTFN